MSARILSSLADDKRDLQKQIGCMNGLFQLFDRRLHAQNHRRLLSGANHMETKCATQTEREKTLTEVTHLGQSTSKTLQDNKRVQQEPISRSRSNLSESPSEIIPAKQSSSSHSGRHSPDLRDVVKDSMYREARGISVRTVAKVEGRVHVMKHIDSPRLLQQSNCGKPSSGTTRVAAKLCDAPWIAEEHKVGCLQHTAKDRPRFSCDGRESTETMKSMMKLKDLPRLSLDSRQQSLRSTASESRSNFLLGDQELQCHNRSSSIVAKLMGLDAFPSSGPPNEIEIVTPKTFPAKDSILISTKSVGKSKINQVPIPPQMLEKDFASPRMKSTSSIMGPASSSRLPRESAPWRQLEANRATQKSSVRCNMEASSQSPHISSSVHREFEKRKTELEFKRSGTDLRALKQILEAMQNTRERSEDQSAQTAPSTKLQPVRQRQQHSPLSLTKKVTHPTKRSEASYLTPQHAKLSDKIRYASFADPTANASELHEFYTQPLVYNSDDTVDKQTSKDMTPRAKNAAYSARHLPSTDMKTKGRTSKALQTTSSQQKEGRFSPALGKSYGTSSPRLQQKQQGMDKQTCQTTPSSETSKVRRQSITESGSSKRNQKAKPSNMQQPDDLNGSSSYKNNFSMASHIETKANTDCFFQIAKMQEDNKERGDAVRLSEDTSTTELAIAAVEQLSPVSVLDATFYAEDSPSPVGKKIVSAFSYRGTDVWYQNDPDHSPYSTRLDLGTASNHKVVKSKEDLVHDLRQPNSTIHDTKMDQLASLSLNHDADNRYITKILLASGLLKDVESMSIAVQLHSSSHLINPKLFHILEQTEESSMLATDQERSEEICHTKFDQKTRRKIIFDTVNEILVHRLGLDNNMMQRRKCWTAKKLLKELKSEIAQLNAKREINMNMEYDELISILEKDMMHRSEDWTSRQDEIPVLVLDVERLIFKDLITEIISDETTEHRRPRSHDRQLQTK